MVFDINDFDETLPAPWEWDVKRLATSFVIAAYHNGFSKATGENLVRRCIKSYREHMHQYARMKVLERWYERIDLASFMASVRTRKAKLFLRARIKKALARTVLEDDFPNLASVEDGQPRIKDNPPLIFHESNLGVPGYRHLIQAAFRRYRQSLADHIRALLDRYEIADVAYKVVGVGSVGTRCAILLMMAGEDDPLFLQVKEARVSVLEPYAGKSHYRNRGQRVVAGQRLMQAGSDLFLGWTVDRGHHYYVRQLRDIKIKPLIEAADVARLERLANWCGWALARAHAKSGDPAMIDGYLGTSSRFDEAVAQFAVGYAEQNARDHKALLKAIRAGKIPVKEG